MDCKGLEGAGYCRKKGFPLGSVCLGRMLLFFGKEHLNFHYKNPAPLLSLCEAPSVLLFY